MNDHHEYLFEQAVPYMQPLLGQSLLLTGMTGLFGLPFLEFICRYKAELEDVSPIWVLTRDSRKFRNKFPQLANNSFLRTIEGDIRSFVFSQGAIDYVVHAASVSNEEKYHGVASSERFDVVLSGTRHLLEVAVKSRAKKILFVSSGSVYGGGDIHSGPTAESCQMAPDVISDSEACYSEAKRAAELQHIICSNTYGVDVTIARCFSFVGPLFPLEINYSIGNFIRDALSGSVIRVTSDGMSIRSFMYTYDLAIWLLCLLVHGENRSAYNVGSEQAISIRELAEAVRLRLNPEASVSINHECEKQKGTQSGASNWYVPSTEKARTRYQLQEWTPLEQAIEFTARYALDYDSV